MAGHTLQNPVKAFICTIGGDSIGQAPDFPSSPQAETDASRAYGALCPGHTCGHFDVFQNAGVPNAAMFVMSPGTGVLRYNPVFMDQTYQYFGPGATLGVIAHETGHHIDAAQTGPSWAYTNSYDKELKADYYAGVALARLGISDYEIKNSLRALSAYPTSTHPAWPQRFQAVDQGFRDGGGAALTFFNPND